MTPLFYEDSLGAKIAEVLAPPRHARRPLSAAEADHIGDLDLLEDADALAAAEREVAVTAQYGREPALNQWVRVFGPAKISGFLDAAGGAEFVFSAPLAAADIPFRWQPYAPGLMPCYRPGDGSVDRPFSIEVPSECEAEAREALAALDVEPTAWGQFALPFHAERTDEAYAYREEVRWLLVGVMVVPDLLSFVFVALYAIIRSLIHGVAQ